MIQLRLGPGDEPDVVTFAQHSGGERADWAQVERYPDAGSPRPLVYVARGSHASYLRAGKHDGEVIPDYNDAGGAAGRPGAGGDHRRRAWLGAVAGLVGVDAGE